MIEGALYVGVAAAVVGVGLLFYWMRDTAARRRYLHAANVALGVNIGAQALSSYHDHSRSWLTLVLAASAAGCSDRDLQSVQDKEAAAHQ